MEGLLLFVAVVGGVAFCAVWLYNATRENPSGDARVMWLTALLPVLLVKWLFVGSVRGLEAAGVTGPTRTRNPETHELVKRETVDPNRPAGAGHGGWPIMGRRWEAVHCGVTGESGAAKGHNIVNYAIKEHLQDSDEHAIILDVKGELLDIVKRYARPGDRVMLYTSHETKKKSSALDLFADIDMAAEIGRILSRPEDSNDQYWAKKAAGLIAADARHLHRKGGGAVSLGDIYDTVSDRKMLEALRDRDPRVDNVADNTGEWGSIRSNALEALEVVEIPRVRRMVDPLPNTTQPDFSAWGGRTIVVIQPSEELAAVLETLVSAILHVLYHRAAKAGAAGGPGTKVYADEAASFMALDRLPTYLELGRARRVQLMYVLQSRKQLVDVLGEDRADRTLAGTELQFIGATTDLGTAEFMEKLSGPARVRYKGPRNPQGERPTLEHFRPKLQAHEVTGQGKGEWTARHHSGLFKFRVPNPSGYYYMQQHPDPRPLKVYGIPKRGA